MMPHVKNYLEGMGYSGYEFIQCDRCGGAAVDIHHVEPRSHFGSKRKNERDAFSNLVALCRGCHDLAHNGDTRAIKEELRQIIKAR